MSKPKCHSYLLRLWQESADEKPHWRLVLVNLAKNEQQGFPNIERLAAFLKSQIDEFALSDAADRDQSG